MLLLVAQDFGLAPHRSHGSDGVDVTTTETAGGGAAVGGVITRSWKETLPAGQRGVAARSAAIVPLVLAPSSEPAAAGGDVASVGHETILDHSSEWDALTRAVPPKTIVSRSLSASWIWYSLWIHSSSSAIFSVRWRQLEVSESIAHSKLTQIVITTSQ